MPSLREPARCSAFVAHNGQNRYSGLLVHAAVQRPRRRAARAGGDRPTDAPRGDVEVVAGLLFQAVLLPHALAGLHVDEALQAEHDERGVHLRAEPPAAGQGQPGLGAR